MLQPDETIMSEHVLAWAVLRGHRNTEKEREGELRSGRLRVIKAGQDWEAEVASVWPAGRAGHLTSGKTSKLEFSFAYGQAYSENRVVGHDLGMWGPAQHALSRLEEYRLQEKVRGDCCSYFQTVGIPPTWTEAPPCSVQQSLTWETDSREAGIDTGTHGPTQGLLHTAHQEHVQSFSDEIDTAYRCSLIGAHWTPALHLKLFSPCSSDIVNQSNMYILKIVS